MIGNTGYITFSVELSTNSDQDNKIATDLTRVILNKSNIPFKEVIGSYSGDRENSFIVHPKYENEVFDIANSANQESILFVGPTGNASLTYLETGKTVSLGKMKQHNKPNGLTSFTFDPVNETYWSTEC